MRIGRETNGVSCEDLMHVAFEKWLIKKGIQYKREVSVREVSRRADFLLWYDSKLINVEAKCNDVSCAISQVTDHSRYCDYAFLLLPDYCIIPKWAIREIQSKEIGLIMYNYESETITEALPAFYNKGRDGKIRRKYINIIMEQQQVINF